MKNLKSNGVYMSKTIKESSTYKVDEEKSHVNTYLTGKRHPIVEQMEKEWPEMTVEFKRIQREQYELFCRKQHDYGPGNISVGTMLQTEEEVQLSLTGLWFRMNDKIQRLKNMLMSKRDSAVDEPLEDAYLDVSNYGIMATIVKNGKWGK
tara:strand:+ start:123 stop:572 length:450 start_codon:yes stop_codon:yes gene_type:complete